MDQELQTLMATKVEKCDYGHVCLICSKAIKGKQEIKRHMKNQHLSSGPVYHCPPCDKYFKNRANIYMHIRQSHKDWHGINYDNFAIRQ